MFCSVSLVCSVYKMKHLLWDWGPLDLQSFLVLNLDLQNVNTAFEPRAGKHWHYMIPFFQKNRKDLRFYNSRICHFIKAGFLNCHFGKPFFVIKKQDHPYLKWHIWQVPGNKNSIEDATHQFSQQPLCSSRRPVNEATFIEFHRLALTLAEQDRRSFGRNLGVFLGDMGI